VFLGVTETLLAIVAFGSGYCLLPFESFVLCHFVIRTFRNTKKLPSRGTKESKKGDGLLSGYRSGGIGSTLPKIVIFPARPISKG